MATLVSVGVLAGSLLAIVLPAVGSALQAQAASKIDPYAMYVGQTRCDPKPKPGVTGVRDLVVAAYGTRWSGISGDCSTPLTSEHKEGRALDVSFDADKRLDKAKADSFLLWLLATDEDGNTHAMARRLGVMYIVWNRRMWRSYRPTDGWQPYTGTANPHTDHIHLSFSWNGALKHTTWWTVGGFPAPGQTRPPTPMPTPTPTDTASPTPTPVPTPTTPERPGTPAPDSPQTQDPTTTADPTPTPDPNDSTDRGTTPVPRIRR